MLAFQIWHCIKRIIYLDQVEFIPGMQAWFKIGKSTNVMYYTNKLKKKKVVWSHHLTKNMSDKIQQSFMLFLNLKIKNGWGLPQLDKSHLQKTYNWHHI